MKLIFFIILCISSITRLYGNLDLVDANQLTSTLNSLSGTSSSIELNDLGKRAFNIKYSDSSGQVSTVDFLINGIKASTDTNSNPYYMYRSGESWLPIAGTYTIEARAYNSAGVLISNDSHDITFSEDLSHRMRKVYITTGNSNQEVEVVMKKHAYIFGSQTVESGSLNSQGSSNDQQAKPYPVRISGYGADSQQMEYISKYQEVFLNNFNMTVAGNAMKWYSNGITGTDFTAADRWLDWHEANDIAVRGHTLLWGRGKENDGGTREMHDQEWVENLMEGNTSSLTWQEVNQYFNPLRDWVLNQTPAEDYPEQNWILNINTNNISAAEQQDLAKLAVRRRIETIVSHYAGRIDEWDFNNELWNYDKYRKEFDGQHWSKSHTAQNNGVNSVLAEFASWAQGANPNIKLFHNDYNIITGSNTNNAASYRNLLLDLRDNHGVPVDGIGVQGHFGGNNSAVRSKQHILDCFNVLDDLGVPIKVTELDVGGISMSESNRAQLLENVYRASFEHPAVEGVLMWGFWSGCHWRRERAPWQYVGYEYNNSNTSNDQPAVWVETEQVTRYRNLVYDEWWTDSTVETNETGMVELSVFAGEYDIIIDGTTFTLEDDLSIEVNESDEPLYLTYHNGQLVRTDGEFKIVQPYENEQFAFKEPIEINAAFPNGATAGIDYVEFYINGDFYKKDSVAPFKMIFFDAPYGTHTISITGQGGVTINDTKNILVADTALGESLISNSGFESGSADSGLVAFGAVNLSVLPNIFFEGSNSLSVVRTGTESWHGLRFDLNLEDGETYQFSSKVLLEQDSDRIALTIKDNSPSLSSPYVTIKELTDVQGATASTDDQGNVITAGWLDISAEFVYNSNMDFIYIAGVDAGENFYVDNISLSKVLPSSNPEDTDADGMLDSWEQANFSTTSTLPNDDADNDGVSNLLEYRSGTNPNNQYSFFGNYDFSSTASSTQMRWLGSADKLYRVLGTTDLNQWTVLGEAIQGHGTTLNTWVEDTTGTPNKFYKVEIDY